MWVCRSFPCVEQRMQEKSSKKRRGGCVIVILVFNECRFSLNLFFSAVSANDISHATIASAATTAAVILMRPIKHGICIFTRTTLCTLWFHSGCRAAALPWAVHMQFHHVYLVLCWFFGVENPPKKMCKTVCCTWERDDQGDPPSKKSRRTKKLGNG